MNAIDKEQGRSLYAGLKERVPPGYGSWESLVEEQVVRAIECRLLGPRCQAYLLANDEAEGFLLERPLINSLADFEQTSLSLDEFMPELLSALNQVDGSSF